jgi:hypothetical protein
MPKSGKYDILCTGASLYTPYSLLLISNKFWMGRGWEGGESGGEKRGGRVGGGKLKGWRGEGLLYLTGGVGGVGEQCSNVTLPHSSPLQSISG